MVFQRPILLLQPALLGDAAEERFDFNEPARLGEVIERPVTQGGDRRFQRALAGEDDRLGLGRRLLTACDHADAVEPRHVEVDDDAVVHIPFERGDGGEPVRADGHAMPQSRQFELHQLLQRLLVIGEQQR